MDYQVRNEQEYTVLSAIQSTNVSLSLVVRGIVGIRPDPMMFVAINCENVKASKEFYEKLGFVEQVSTVLFVVQDAVENETKMSNFGNDVTTTAISICTPGQWNWTI